MARLDEPDNPAEHLTFCGNRTQVWGKLEYDASRFWVLSEDEAPNAEHMGFALIDVCISALAVRDWSLAHYKRRFCARDAKELRPAFYGSVAELVPYYPICKAVANTFKHSEYRDEGLLNLRCEIITSRGPWDDGYFRSANSLDDLLARDREIRKRERHRLRFKHDGASTIDAPEWMDARLFCLGTQQGWFEMMGWVEFSETPAWDQYLEEKKQNADRAASGELGDIDLLGWMRSVVGR